MNLESADEPFHVLIFIPFTEGKRVRPEMEVRIQRVLTNDPGLGVLRHADAGYPEAVATLETAEGLRHPML